MSAARPPGFWAATRMVAVRGFTERARDKSFLGSTAFTLLIVLAAVLVPQLLGAGDPTTYRVAFAGQDAGLVREAARQQAQALDVRLEVRDVPPGDARARVEAEELDAVVDGDGVIVREELEPGLAAVLQGAHRQVRVARGLEGAGIDPAAVERASAVGPLAVQALDPVDQQAQSREGIAFFATFVLYGQLLGYGLWVALGVVEEKSSRVVEVLLAAVSPRALLAGKILGIGLLGLIQLLVIAVVGLGAGSATGALDLDAGAVSTVALVLGWFLLGYAFYASLFAAAAARVSRQEDLQNVTTPATLLVLVSLFAAFYVGQNPDRPISRVLSVLPPFSALVNAPRVAAGDVPGWEVALAVGVMLVAIAAVVLVAARLYEGAILHMGSKVGLRQAWARQSTLPTGQARR